MYYIDASNAQLAANLAALSLQVAFPDARDVLANRLFRCASLPSFFLSFLLPGFPQPLILSFSPFSPLPFSLSLLPSSS
jgi:hypothetical protein